MAIHIGFPFIFPSLLDLGKQIFVLFQSNDFLLSVSVTIFRGIIGFSFAFVMSLILATIALSSKFWKSFFQPLIVIARSIPVISFVLIALLWFSPPNLPVFIAVITMFPILYQNILTGFEQTDNKWLEMAKVFGKSPGKRFFSIYLPASKSIIFDGMSTSMGFGWRAIIIGEVLAQPLHGIGTSMKQAQAYINISELIAWTVVAVAVSYLFEFIFRFIRKIKIKNKFPENVDSNFDSNRQVNAKSLKIKIKNINKEFTDRTVFISFTEDFDNDTLNFIKGISGKGKTTLFRLISGLDNPDSGEIFHPETISFGYSFQDTRLLPWLTVSENIAYGIGRGFNKKENFKLVGYLLDKLELTEHSNNYPLELSGGQQQRVNLARALASQSDILLLDEPLTGLDIELKSRIIDFLSAWIKVYCPLVIWATHEEIHLTNLHSREIIL